MSLVLRFNKFILIPALIEWLYPSEFLNFDSALCNHTDREYLLTILQDYSAKFQGFIFSTLPSISLSVAIFDWITQRLRNFRISNESVVLEVNNASLKSFRLSLDPTARARLLTFFSMIKRLDIMQCSGVNVKYLTEEFFVTCSGIEEVAAYDSNDEEKPRDLDAIVSSIATSFANLRVFCLVGCRLCSESAVISVVRHCSLLTEINLGSAVRIDVAFMMALTVHGRRIRNLHAQGSRRLTSRLFLIFFLHNSKVSLGAVSFPNSFRSRVEKDISLRSMMWFRGGDQLRQLSFLVGGESHTLETLEVVSRGCPNIEILSIFYLPKLTSTIYSTLFTNWSKLLVLNLPNLPYSKFRFVLLQVFDKCTLVQELCCFQSSPSSSRTPVDPELFKLDKFNCHELTVLDVYGNIATEEYYGMLSQSRKLRVLKIERPKWSQNLHRRLTEDVALYSGSYLQQLEEFSFPACESQLCFELLLIHSRCLKVLSVPNLCEFPMNDEIDLRNVTHLTFQSSGQNLPGEELWLRCPNLTYLKFNQQFGLPYATALVENLPKLKELEIHVKVPKTHKIFRLNKKLIVTNIVIY